MNALNVYVRLGDNPEHLVGAIVADSPREADAELAFLFRELANEYEMHAKDSGGQ